LPTAIILHQTSSYEAVFFISLIFSVHPDRLRQARYSSSAPMVQRALRSPVFSRPRSAWRAFPAPPCPRTPPRLDPFGGFVDSFGQFGAAGLALRFAVPVAQFELTWLDIAARFGDRYVQLKECQPAVKTPTTAVRKTTTKSGAPAKCVFRGM
jgi:hypothetical protein